MLSRFAIWTALVCSLCPAVARAQPLDLADPTPRTIQVEFEVSADPATVGQTYSTSFDATYSATGNTGTVVISGAEYEAAIQAFGLDYFDVILTGTLVSASASDFVLDIDLTTLEGTALPFSYQISITSPVQQIGTVTRNLSTTALAGFAFVPEIPGFPVFCDFCLIVPGAPYDPTTGKINAVGSDQLDAPDIDLLGFSRAGDLRLTESAAPSIPALSTYGLAGLAVGLMGFAFLTIRRERRSAQPTVDIRSTL
jgi:hypothetical protein